MAEPTPLASELDPTVQDLVMELTGVEVSGREHLDVMKNTPVDSERPEPTEPAVNEDVNNLIFDLVDVDSVPSPTVEQVEQIRDVVGEEREDRELEDLPEESNTPAPVDVVKGVGRAVVSTAGGIAALPRALKSFGEGILPEALTDTKLWEIEDWLVESTTDKFASWAGEVATEGFLAPDPEAELKEEGFAVVGEAISNPAWWTNRYPEIASQVVAIFLPGIAAAKGASLLGASSQTAARLGRSVQVATMFALEAGTTYTDLVDDLIANGVPEGDARVIASRGAMAYGVVSGLLEHKLVNFLGAGAGKGRVMRVIRGGAGEMTTEELQLLAQAATVAVIEASVDVELRPVLTGAAIFESGVGGLSGGGLMSGLTSSAFATEEAMIEAITKKFNIPEAQAQRLMIEGIEALPQILEEQAKEIQREEAPADPAPPPEPDEATTAPTEGTPTAPAATEPGEGAVTLKQQLDAAKSERATKISFGEDTTEVDQRIKDLKAQIVQAADATAEGMPQNVAPENLTADDVTAAPKVEQTREAADKEALRQQRIEAKKTRKERQVEAALQDVEAKLEDRIQKGMNRVDDQIKEVQKNIPRILSKVQRDSINKALFDVTTPKQLQKVLARIRENVAKQKQKRAQARLKDLIKKTDLTQLPEKGRGQEEDPGTRSALTELLKLIDTKDMSEAQKEVLERYREFIERRGEWAVKKKQADEVARLDKTRIKDMSEAEADEISDEIEAAVELSKKENRERRRRMNESKIATGKKSAKEMDDTAKREKKLFSRTGKIRKGGFRELVRMVAGKEYALTLESLLELISGSDKTVTVRVLFDQVYEASNRMRGRFRRIMAGQNDLIRAMGLQNSILEWVRQDNGRIDRGLKAIGVRQPKQGEIIILPDENARPGEPPSGERTIELFKGERALFVALISDRSTFDLIVHDGVPIWTASMAEGESMTLRPGDVQAILNSATAEEVALANQMVEMMNGSEAEVWAEVTRRIFGKAKVRNDGDLYVSRQRVRGLDDKPFTPQNFKQRATKNAGIGKDRQDRDKTNPIKVNDIFTAYQRWASMHSAVTELAESMEFANSVLNSKEVQASINNHYGREVAKRIQDTYDTLTSSVIGGGRAQHKYDRIVRWMANNVTKARLFFRPKIATYQIASLSTAATEIDLRLIGRSLWAAKARGQVNQEMYEWSPFIWDRNEQGGVRFIDSAYTQELSILGEFQGIDLDAAGGFMIKEMDGFAIRVIWEASKLQAAQDGYTGDALMVKTAQIAERVIRRTQPSWDAMSISGLALEARTSGSARIINFFRGQRQKNVDMTIMNYVRMRRKQLTKGKAAGKQALVNIAQPGIITMWKAGWRMLPMLAMGLAEGDDLDEIFEGELQAAAKDFIGAELGNFLYGSFATDLVKSAAFGDPSFGFQSSPLFGPWEKMFDASMSLTRNLQDERDAEKFVDDGMDLMIGFSDISGVPISAVEDFFKFIDRGVNRDEFKARRDGGGRRSSGGRRGRSGGA